MKIMGRALWGIAVTVIFAAGILLAVNSISGIDEIDSMDLAADKIECVTSSKKESVKNPYTSYSKGQDAYQTQNAPGSQSQASSDANDIQKTGAGHDVAVHKDIAHDDVSHNDAVQNDAVHKDVSHNDAVHKENSFQTVSQEYFSDAVFIGDSRTVGMQQSGLISNAVYYAKVGIGIGEILSSRFVWEDGMSLTVPEALSRHSFGKVYIMVGINDMSAGDTDWFVEQYEEILRVVRKTQPDALIYIQGNIPMSYYTQDLSGALNNPNLEERNEASKALADGKDIFYLDAASVYADDNGHLLSQYTSDGLHVLKKYYPLWVDYLCQHAIVRG